MKILLLSDIHANWAALSAIRESFDVCLCLGDLVEYGADPVPCIEWVRRHAHAAIRGNHDHSTVQRISTSSGGGNSCRRLASATREQHWQVLQPSHLKFLSRLPVTQSLQLDGKTFYLVHATPRDPLDEYLSNDPAGWNARLANIEADFVCVGHTHIPVHLQLERCQLINPGSVGQPRDGDARAAYAVIENGEVSFRRVEYDIDAAIEQMRSAGLAADIVELAAGLLRTGGRQSEPRMAAT